MQYLDDNSCLKKKLAKKIIWAFISFLSKPFST